MGLLSRAGHSTIVSSVRNDNETMLDNVIELQWPEKKMKIVRSQCLGVATTNIDLMQEPTILWPENMVLCPALLFCAYYCNRLNIAW